MLSVENWAAFKTLRLAALSAHPEALAPHLTRNLFEQRMNGKLNLKEVMSYLYSIIKKRYFTRPFFAQS